jgi:hypothetical protein
MLKDHDGEIKKNDMRINPALIKNDIEDKESAS